MMRRFLLGMGLGFGVAVSVQACCNNPPKAFLETGDYQRAEPIEALDIGGGAILRVAEDLVVLEYTRLSMPGPVRVEFEVVGKDVPE